METKSTNKRKWYDTLIVLYVQTEALFLAGSLVGSLLIRLLEATPLISGTFLESDFWQISSMYLSFIGIWLVMLLRLWVVKKDRPIITAVGPKVQENNWKMVLAGTVLGFALNAVCVLVAWLHKDIVLYFDSLQPIQLLALFIAVCVQSSAEELVCRGFLYGKLRKSYRNPAVAIIGNSLFFGVLHLMNPGVTVLSVVNIVMTALLFSLIVYYTDSMWCVFMVHTAWNYTQNILFGLPNSGIVSPFSVFKLDASTAANSFAYNVGFGIEGTLMAVVVLILATAAVYVWGSRRGAGAAKQPAGR